MRDGRVSPSWLHLFCQPVFSGFPVGKPQLSGCVWFGLTTPLVHFANMYKKNPMWSDSVRHGLEQRPIKYGGGTTKTNKSDLNIHIFLCRRGEGTQVLMGNGSV